MRFSITQMLIAIACICLVLGAFTRGYYLLGISEGVFFAILVTATLFVVVRVFAKTRKSHLVRQVLAVVLALIVFAILATPAQFSSDLGHFIDGHQIERLTRTQLQSIFLNDPRFAQLEFDCNYSKGIGVTVDGTIQSESDLRDLRDRIFEQCPSVSSRRLYWRLQIVDSNVRHDDRDLTIFGDTNPNAG